MRLFGSRLSDSRAGLGETSADSDSAEHESATPSEVRGSIPGERGPASVHRARSLQSRVSNLLAAGLMTALGVGVLSWYPIMNLSEVAIRAAKYRSLPHGDVFRVAT